MTTLLQHASFAAESRSIADRLATAANGVLPSLDGTTPPQISRRALLRDEAPVSTGSTREPDPDPDLQQLGRYITWRYAGATTVTSSGPGDESSRARWDESDAQALPPGLVREEVLNRNLEHFEWAPELWGALDDQMLAWLVFQRLVTFARRGISVDPSLAGMYPTVAARLSEGQRMQLLADVGFALEPDREQVGVLLPFLYNDASAAVTAYAAFLWAQRTPAGDDPMDGVRAVVRLARMLARVEVDRPQLILTGLIALGDGRALPTLEGCWRWFPENQKHWLGSSLFTPVTAAQLEWTLRWMEDSADNDLGFGAKALVNAADRGGDAPLIYDLSWHLPVPRVDDPDDPVWQYPWSVLQIWTFPQYAAILEPRLRRILLREETEPIVPYVLAAWGLEPGEWDEIDQLRRIGQRYLAHVDELRQLVATPTTDEARAWARARIAGAIAGAAPLKGLAQLLDPVARATPQSRWTPADPNPPTGNDEASVTRARADTLRRLLRARFGPNLSAVVSDLMLLERRWPELGLAESF